MQEEWLQLHMPREDRATFNIASLAALNQSTSSATRDLSQDSNKDNQNVWLA